MEGKEKEDGELSPEELDDALPPNASFSEQQIDRIIQEVQHISCRLTPPPPPPVLVKNMLFPEELDQARSPATFVTNTDEIETLREAALVSMKSNGLEEGEVREEAAPHRSERNFSHNRARTSVSDRQQWINSTNDTSRRRQLSPTTRRNTSSRDNWNHKEDSRSRRARDKSSEPRRKKGKWRHRSGSGERRKTKEQRDSRVYDEVSAVSTSAVTLAESQPLINPHHRPRSRRNDIEHQKLIFGGELPSQLFATSVTQNELHDNHDLVNMDVDSDNRTTPPATPNRPRPSVEDESVLRNILMEQLNTKKAKPTTVERSESSEDLIERQHKENQKKLEEYERDVAEELEIVLKLDERRARLIRELKETFVELAEHQTRYWEQTKARDELRPIVEDYNRKKVRRIDSNKHVAGFFDFIQEQEKKLKESAARAHEGQPTTQNTPEAVSKTRAVASNSKVQAMGPSVAPYYTAEEENEINLRQILLQKQQGKVNGSQQRSAPSSANQTVEGPAEEIPAAVNTSTRRETPPQSPRASSGIQTPAAAERNLFEPRTPQAGRSPTLMERETTPEPLHKRLQKYQRFGIPLRLFPHAGLELPHELEIERMICPFELNGKCKDVDCQHRHLKDDELQLREVVAMIVCNFPNMSGHFETETYSMQINHLLCSQLVGEGRREFLQRILSGFASNVQWNGSTIQKPSNN